VGLKGSIGALCLVVASIFGTITVPLAGWLSDRLGRVPVYRAAVIFQLVSAIPIWWTFSHGDVLTTVIGISLGLSLGVWGMFGAQGALLPELFGSRHRYIGVSVAREASAIIAGGIAPFIGSALISWAATSLGSAKAAWFPIAIYLIVLSLITLVTTFLLPETRGRNLDDPRDAA
jgi:MFS transporter, MHS family, metabolite:H+ symporter